MYCEEDDNCFAKLPTEKLIQALEFSEKYDIYHIYKKCLSCLRRKNINPSNVINFFDYGLKKRFNDIVRKCIKVFATKGISVKFIREDFSVTALRNLLSLDTIVMNSEAELLELAISWLSYHGNERYKSDVLSFIDLQSVQLTEYQDICMRYPNFFTDDDLSAIFLSQLRQDPKLLPKWYKPRIKTIIENKCSLCVYIEKTMRISKPLQFLEINSRKDLKSIYQKFEFQFPHFPQVKMLNIKLNFGPHEIAPEEFTLQSSLGRNVPVQKYYVNTSKCNKRYQVFFTAPLALKSNDTLILKFHFRRGLIANNIHIIRPIIEQPQLKSSDKDECYIYLIPSELAFYRSRDLSDKYIVSTFYLNACDNHCIYLYRKCIDVPNEMDLDNKLSDKISQKRPFNTDLKKDINIAKKETGIVKMEIDSDNQRYANNVTFIKKEIISLDSSTDEQYRPFRIVDQDKMTHKVRILKSEVVDLAE